MGSEGRLEWYMPRVLRLLLMAIVAAMFASAGACTSTVRTTDPARTATEQFLQSQAVVEAVRQLNVDPLRDRLVYVDGGYLSATDRQFLLGEVRAHMIEQGVRVTDHRDQAAVIAEVRTAGLGIDRSGVLVGIPPLVLPATVGEDATLGMITQFATPELSLFKNIRQHGFASVAVVAYFADTGDMAASTGPFIGRTQRTDWWLFGLGHQIRGDIPTTERE